MFQKSFPIFKWNFKIIHSTPLSGIRHIPHFTYYDPFYYKYMIDMGYPHRWSN